MNRQIINSQNIKTFSFAVYPLQRYLIILDTLGSNGSNGIIPFLIFFRRGYENTYSWYDITRFNHSENIQFSLDNNTVTATCDFNYIHATILSL